METTAEIRKWDTHCTQAHGQSGTQKQKPRKRKIKMKREDSATSTQHSDFERPSVGTRSYRLPVGDFWTAQWATDSATAHFRYKKERRGGGFNVFAWSVLCPCSKIVWSKTVKGIMLRSLYIHTIKAQDFYRVSSGGKKKSEGIHGSGKFGGLRWCDDASYLSESPSRENKLISLFSLIYNGVNINQSIAFFFLAFYNKKMGICLMNSLSPESCWAITRGHGLETNI